jgi:hypothetical protein
MSLPFWNTEEISEGAVDTRELVCDELCAMYCTKVVSMRGTVKA